MCHVFVWSLEVSWKWDWCCCVVRALLVECDCLSQFVPSFAPHFSLSPLQFAFPAPCFVFCFLFCGSLHAVRNLLVFVAIAVCCCMGRKACWVGAAPVAIVVHDWLVRTTDW